MVLRKFNNKYNVSIKQYYVKTVKEKTNKKYLSGAQFVIGFDKHQNVVMKWKDSRNNMKPCHSQHILNELADKVLRNQIFESGKEEVIHGYTEYKIDNEYGNK